MIFDAITAAIDRNTVAIERHNERVDRAAMAIVRGMDRLEDRLAEINRTLRRFIRPAKPGPVSLVVISENGNMLTYKLTLPPSTASDVAARILTVNGVETTLAADATEYAEATGQKGDQIVGQLVDRDDEDPPNDSTPRSFSFTLRDNQAPPQPGEVGLLVTGETP